MGGGEVPAVAVRRVRALIATSSVTPADPVEVGTGRADLRMGDAWRSGSEGLPLHLNVGDALLRVALEHVAVAAGHLLVVNPASADLSISDELPVPGGRVDILVAASTPVGARIAVGAVVTGLVSGVIAHDDPEHLPTAIECARREVAALPQSILLASIGLPCLTSRQHQILACMSIGMLQDRPLAQAQNVSTATVKREVRWLLDDLVAPGRHDLARIARQLGFERPLGSRELALLCLAGDDPPTDHLSSGDSSEAGP